MASSPGLLAAEAITLQENDGELNKVRIQLARIEGMLTRAHGDYDRRIENLEKGQAGTGARLATYLSPVIAAVAVAVSFYK